MINTEGDKQELIIENTIKGEEEDKEEDIDEYFKENKKEEKSFIIGIDLGTTNSCVGVWRNNNFEVICDENGNRTIPSIVAYTKISRYVGNSAKNQKELNFKNVIYEVKRLMGRKSKDIINDREFITYDVDSDKYDNVIIKVDEKIITPEEISSIILLKLKSMAEDYLKMPVREVIISIPAYFNDAARQATKDAATIAGLKCLKLINEPTSAALAYGLMNRIYTNKNGEKNMDNYLSETNVVVYDLGGGTLDVSILQIESGIFQAIALNGNNRLGGADFDDRLMSYCCTYFKNTNREYFNKNYNGTENIDFNPLSIQKLRSMCENAKIALSTSVKTIIAVKEFHDNIDLIIKLTRDKYYEIVKDLLILCMHPLDEAMEEAFNICGLRREDIHEVILVGGMTKMPIIRENIKNYFNGKTPNCSVNPDEVVAMGAAIQGYILSHQNDPFTDTITLLDIIPLSLGVETYGGIMNVILPKNTIIPASKTKTYSNDKDFVTEIVVKVYEGQRKMTKHNLLIGEFILGGLKPLQRGKHEIDVTFTVDANGIITVTAEDLIDKNKKEITITGNKGRLKPDEIKKLAEEAKLYEITDKLERNKKKLYFDLDSSINNILINLKCEENKLDNEEKEKIEKSLSVYIEWLKEKKYFERSEQEYIDIFKILKRKYGILILFSDKNSKNVTGKINDKATTIYEEDDVEEMKNIFEKIEKEEIGKTDVDINEIKEIKNILIENCLMIQDILSGKSFNETEESINLKYIIEDTLLWSHIHQNPKKSDYIEKINMINDLSNSLIKDNQDFFTDYRSALEDICKTIKYSIEANQISLSNLDMNILKNKVNESLNYLENGGKDKNEICKRLDDVNKLCDSLFDKMMNNSSN